MGKKAIIRLPKGKVAKNVQYNCVDGSIEVSYEVEDKFQPKDGDFLHNKNNDTTVIYKGTYESGGIITYAGAYSNTITFDIGRGWGRAESYRYATLQEKQALLDRLEKECGKRWNPDAKQIEDIRWRANVGQKYWYVDNTTIYEDTELIASDDDERHKRNNYFRTREAAQKVADQIKEIFKNSKPE